MSESHVADGKSLLAFSSLLLPLPKAIGDQSSRIQYGHRLALYILSSLGLRLYGGSKAKRFWDSELHVIDGKRLKNLMVPAPCPLKTPGVSSTPNRHARRLVLHSMDISGLMLHLESM